MTKPNVPTLRYADLLRRVYDLYCQGCDACVRDRAALRRLADLCEEAERVAAWDNTLKTFDESRLVRGIAAGYREDA